MRTVMKWFRDRTQGATIDGEIAPVYTASDARSAPEGHMPLTGTDIEVVAYRVQGTDDLMLCVNKGGMLIFRAKLVGAASEAVSTETLWKWNMHAFDKPIEMGQPSEDFVRLAREMLEKKT